MRCAARGEAGAVEEEREAARIDLGFEGQCV